MLFPGSWRQVVAKPELDPGLQGVASCPLSSPGAACGHVYFQPRASRGSVFLDRSFLSEVKLPLIVSSARLCVMGPHLTLCKRG